MKFRYIAALAFTLIPAIVLAQSLGNVVTQFKTGGNPTDSGGSASGVDAFNNAAINGIDVFTFGMTFNNTSWDRQISVRNTLNNIGQGVIASGVVGQFDDTATTTCTENNFCPIRFSSDRFLYVTPQTPGAVGAPTVVFSAASETGHVLKASGGNLIDLEVATGAAAGYVMVFNSTTVPVAGAVTPVMCFAVPVTGNIVYQPAPGLAEAFNTGISAAFSTTGCFTKTDSATAFFHARVQ